MPDGKKKTPRKTPAESQLEALEAATGDPSSVAARQALQSALAAGPAIVAARAAHIVRAHTLDGFAPTLEGAFRRFLVDPVKSDPGCRAKLGAIEALDYGLHDDPRCFFEATGHVQMEPAWGPPVDTAVGLRSRGVLALARLEHPDLPLIAGRLLADEASPVRQAAAEALASRGERGLAGLLLLRWRLGDEDPLVVMACMAGALSLAADWALPDLRRALVGADEAASEMALLALGQSGRDDALDILLEHLETTPASRRAPTLRALGLHRTPRALSAVLDVIVSGGAAEARAAIAALAPRRFEPGVADRVRAAAGRNDRADLTADVAAAFPPTTR